ncbi:hypothetical protein EAF04_010112 [Stromatinia cepivora]|nr:hypothetical protein EAF04_010112 [Stromatinia cepivora]
MIARKGMKLLIVLLRTIWQQAVYRKGKFSSVAETEDMTRNQSNLIHSCVSYTRTMVFLFHKSDLSQMDSEKKVEEMLLSATDDSTTKLRISSNQQIYYIHRQIVERKTSPRQTYWVDSRRTFDTFNQKSVTRHNQNNTQLIRVTIQQYPRSLARQMKQQNCNPSVPSRQGALPEAHLHPSPNITIATGHSSPR